MELFEKLRRYYYRRKAIRALKRRYRLDSMCDEIMKDWVTACIIERRQEGRRKELIEAQTKIKEEELFLKWLKTLKYNG